MDESSFKSKWCSLMRAEGGYARRFEDQYAVGIPDVDSMPIGGPLFKIEAKIIRSPSWGATPRQMEELERIKKADAGNNHVIACEMGYREDSGGKVITLRRIHDPKEKWRHIKIDVWTRFSPSTFLQFCLNEWERLDG